MRRWIVSSFVLLLFVAGCLGKEQSINLEQTARAYLEAQGYRIIAFEGSSKTSYSKESLGEFLALQKWSVQYVVPDKYIDKQIDELSFLVQNHPLDLRFKTSGSYTGLTNVTVFLLNGKVFGGTSFPDSSEALYGAPYSIDGKTAEEIHDNYDAWLEAWNKKYGRN